MLVNKSLNFFNDEVLFPKKIGKANEVLKSELHFQNLIKALITNTQNDFILANREMQKAGRCHH